jgi:hypothetical protein
MLLDTSYARRGAVVDNLHSGVRILVRKHYILIVAFHGLPQSLPEMVTLIQGKLKSLTKSI